MVFLLSFFRSDKNVGLQKKESQRRRSCPKNQSLLRATYFVLEKPNGSMEIKFSAHAFLPTVPLRSRPLLMFLLLLHSNICVCPSRNKRRDFRPKLCRVNNPKVFAHLYEPRTEDSPCQLSTTLNIRPFPRRNG